MGPLEATSTEPAHAEAVLIRKVSVCTHQHTAGPEESVIGQTCEHAGVLWNDGIAAQRCRCFAEVPKMFACTLNLWILMLRNEGQCGLVIRSDVERKHFDPLWCRNPIKKSVLLK